MAWLMGAALVLSVVLILGLLSLIFIQGAATFWQRPVDHVVLRSGEAFLGSPIQEEAFDPSPDVKAQIESLSNQGVLGSRSFNEQGLPLRRLYRVGNRDLEQEPFRWVNLIDIASVDRPGWALHVERQAWGIWLGTPQAIIEQTERVVPAAEKVIADERVDAGGTPIRITREVIGTGDQEGSQRIRERRWIAEGEQATWAAFERLHPEAMSRIREIASLQRHELGRNNAQLESWRRSIREAQLQLNDAREGRIFSLGWMTWALVAGVTIVAGSLTWLLPRRWKEPDPRDGLFPRLARGVVIALCLLVTIAGFVAVAMERPWQQPMTPERLAQIEAEGATARADIEAKGAEIMDRIRGLEVADDRYRIIIQTPRKADGTESRFAPVRSTLPDEPMRVSQVVRAVPANQLSLVGKLGLYASRWWELVSEEPREVNTEGGVFPVIFGTVAMTLLLSVLVVPLGVVAALYMREYAKQGLVTSFVRIAVNNLAGVPSIVYGVFGLGFFCYTLGGYIDAGPEQAARASRAGWWAQLLIVALVLLATICLGLFAKPVPGTPSTRLQTFCRVLVGLGWLTAVALVAMLLWTTPYFSGFFRSSLPNQTMGTRGLLWASLTLALLTLPVVIVATEEAVSAVPRSMREGSYGCGASKWQTIRRIVLPGAMPGIMTGMILAMARGAGEVAPLMLVGAVKLAPDLPVSTEFPFVHLERSFMHLGFHIYDLGFQSPDSEAAKPLVWTTTLLLIVIVVMLNLVAVTIRARLRAKLRSNQF